MRCQPPEIIFADEPTGNLDSRTGAEILSFMRTAVRELGQTIVMVTHDPVAASYADRAVFLADGRIVDDLDDPTADSVLDRITTSEADHHVPLDHQGARRTKLRLLTTAFAVLLGVAFMAGTLMFTDTMAPRSTGLAEANAGIDAYVRTPSEIDLGFGEPGPRLDAVARRHRRLGRRRRPGGAARQRLRPDRRSRRQARRRRLQEPGVRHELGRRSTTSTRTSWPAATRRIGDDEIVIDKASADKAGYQPGDVATVLTKSAPRQFTIAGIAKFGAADSPAGRRRCSSPTRTAAELLATPGQADAIAVTADHGVSQADIAAAVQAAVGDGRRGHHRRQLIAENQAALGAELRRVRARSCWSSPSSPCSSVRSSSTTRSRSPSRSAPGRWRCCGRSAPPAVRSSARCSLEAVVVGVLASGLGLVAGIGVAAGLRQLMSAFGFDMPDGPTVIAVEHDGHSRSPSASSSPSLSAWLPARRAAKIAPIAALRDVTSTARQVRLAGPSSASVITAVGVAALLAGLSGELALRRSRCVGDVRRRRRARPGARPTGRMRCSASRCGCVGISGELATRNAMRNPKRTARTAASLMIGVALVGFITIFAASAKTSLAGSLETDFTGTHIVESGSDGQLRRAQPRPGRRAARRRDGVDVVTEARLTPAIVDGSATDAFHAFDATTVGDAVRPRSRSRATSTPSAPTASPSRPSTAAEHGLDVGSHGAGDVPDRRHGTFVVRPIYDGGTDWVGPMFVDLDALAANGADATRLPGLRVGRRGGARQQVAGAYGVGRRARQAWLPRLRQHRDRHHAQAVLRHADAGRRDRPARHRQHAGAVDLRAEP